MSPGRLVLVAMVMSCLWAPGLRAQAEEPTSAGVRGTLMTTGGEPIPAATVDLVAPGDSTALASTISGAGGGFRIDSIPAATYELLVTHLGHGRARTDEFTVLSGRTRNLGTIRLDVAALDLEPITVVVERPDVVFEPDRTSYLVEAIAGTGGVAVADVLRTLPQVGVDFDGRVRLFGEAAEIYINGRPAPMGGASLIAFLEQFPADQIEQVEVIDSPTGRFEAAGAGGIINIVLKEGVSLGLSGSVSVSAGTRGRAGVGGRATLHDGPWTMNVYGNSDWSDSEGSEFTLRENLLAEPTTFLRQDSRGDRSSRSTVGMLDLRYALSESLRLRTRLSADRHDSDRSSLTETAHLDAERNATLEYDRLAETANQGGSTAIAVGLEHAWQPRRHTLELEATGRWGDERGDQRDETTADAEFEGAEPLPPALISRRDDRDEEALGLELDYVRPLGPEGRLEVGLEVERSDASDDQEKRSYEASETDPPDDLDVRHTSRVRDQRSAYLTLQQRFGSFGVRAGVRAEFVDDEYVFSSGTTIDRSEPDIFPDLGVSWAPPESDARVRFSYSRRIQRPRLSVLDPTDRSTDPLNRSVGNPEIEPSTTHNVVARVSWQGAFGMLVAGPYWRRTTDGWEQITTVDAEGVSTTTWDNLTSRTHVGISLTWRPRRSPDWNGYIDFTARRSTIDGGLVASEVEDGQLRWSVRAALFGRLVGALEGRANIGYEPARTLAQGRSSGRWTADLGFRHRLLDDRAKVGLAVRDPFELQETSAEIHDPTVVQTERTSVSSRSVTLTVSYSFGGGGR